MCNLKRNDTGELIHKTERLTALESEVMVARGKGRESRGEWIHVYL